MLNNKPKTFLNEFKKDDDIHAWLESWKNAVHDENKDINQLALELDKLNPIYIPRNHQVQQTIEQAYEGDFSKFSEMLNIIKRPFDGNEKYSEYEKGPLEEQKVKKTFCGT